MNLPPVLSATAGRQPLRLRLGAFLLLVPVCWIAFFRGLDSLGLMDKTEALFVEVARGMVDSGDWITPRWNGETFFDYPVWGYWMVGLSFRIFGPHEWAARLPPALSASLAVLALYGLLLRLAPSGEPEGRVVGRAFLAATVLALSPGWVGWGRSSVTDMFLASAIGLALFSFLLAHLSAQHGWAFHLGHAGVALFAGVAVLAKGPVGLLLPGLVIGVYLLLRGRLLNTLRLTPWLPMGALFLAVASPWYVAATRVNGMEFLSGFLGFSNLERFTSVIYDHPGPPWFYLPWVLILLFPWSLYLPVAVARSLPRGRAAWAAWRQTSPGPSDLPLFALVWLVVVVLFFSAAATKLPGYILPAVPGGALLVGLFLRPFSADGSIAGPAHGVGPGARLTGGLNALLLGLLAVAAALAPRLAGGDPSHPGFAAAVAASGLPTLLALLFAAASLALVALLVAGRHQALHRLWWPNAAAMLAVLALVVPGVGTLIDRERQRPVRDLARVAGERAQGDEPLVVVGYKRYSVVYYSGMSVLFVSGPDRVRRALGERGDRAPSTLLLLGSEAELRDFGLAGSEGTILARSGSHRLLRLPTERLPERMEP